MEFKKYYKEFILGILFILVLGLYSLFFYFYYFKEDTPLEVDLEAPIKEVAIVEEQKEEPKIFVEVKGEVKKPGVYASTKETIINTIIELAGGFTSAAYTKNINLSKAVSNEMVIYVYSKYEYSQLNQPKIVYIEKECKCPEYDISSCINSGNSIIENGPEENSTSSKEESKGDNTENLSEKININTATKDDLTKINGIGDSKAQSIIDYRNEKGNFSKIEDIINVSGISSATFEKIKNNITV